MSCYFRHLKGILDEAKIKVTPVNKKEIDQALHRIVGVDYKNCPATWKQLKQELASDEQRKQDLIRKLQDAIR